VVLRGERGWRRARAIGVAATVCAAFGLLPAAASAARHFEKVSPADKGFGDIVGDGLTTVAAVAGDAVAFSTRTPFGDTVGSANIGHTQYVARRTDEAWVVHAITPAPRSDAKQTFFSPTILPFYSDDLSTAVLRGYDLPAATDDTPLRNNLYVENTATRALRTVTVSQVEVPPWFEFLNWPLEFWGISADARHVAFVTASQFLADAVPGVPNVYQWDDGVLRVASVLPDGSVPADGANTPVNLRGAMSADGSRLLFTALSSGGNPQLFLRIDASRTAWVSQSEVDGSADPTNVRPLGMTPDGRSVFFTTDTPLLPEDGNSGTDLYRYTDSAGPSSDPNNLTLISQGGDLDFGQLIGMSDDGERVYYQTSGSSFMVWDNGNTLIRVVPPADFELSASPGNARVTPDGMFLAFRANATIDDGTHGLTGEVINNHFEMYLYSLRNRRLICVSCPSAPATSDAIVRPAATQGDPRVENAGLRPRFLSEDGRVFFSTGDALVVQDTNGVLDTYEYDPATGRVSLLSTGTGKDPATFADANASGDDVFIVTRQRLVASDRDDLVDLYDVRDGSSLPPEVVEQPRSECEGDGCQPPSPASPSKGLLGSLSFEDGAGSAGARLLAVRERIVLHGASGLLRVRLFAAGRLAWSGRGLRAGSISRRAGRYGVRLRLSRRGRAQLRASGVFRTSVHLTFVSVGGDEVKRTTRVTFRVAERKGR